MLDFEHALMIGVFLAIGVLVIATLPYFLSQSDKHKNKQN